MAKSVSVPKESQPVSRWRGIVTVICIVLAGVLTVPAAFAYWGQRTINDGQRYVDTVGPLVDSPEVQAAIATKITAVLEDNVDVEALVNQVFGGVISDRPRLQALVGPLAGAIDGLIETQVRNFVASDAFADLWVAANTRAQQALHQLLQGEGSGAVSIQGDQVVLDVSQMIEAVKQRLVDRGLTIIEKVPVTTQDRQIVLLNAPQLKQVRSIYRLANPVAQWLLVLVALLYLGAFLLARRRARMAVIIGVVVAANGLLLALVVSLGEDFFVNQLSGTVFGPASKVFYHQLLTYLERGQRVVVWLGLLLVAVGWYSGRNASGTAVRTKIGGWLETLGAELADGPVAGAGRFVQANVGWLRVVIGVLGVVVLLWGNQASEERLFWSVLLVVVLLMTVQILIGAAGGRRRPAIAAPATVE